MRGYAGKFVEIDLADGKTKDVKFPDETLKDYIGGRGLAAKLLWDRFGERWEEVDPLAPENIITFFTGPLTGYYPGARLSVSGKSPQSNGIIGSSIGCELPIEMKCAGIDGLIVTGRAEKPVYIWVTDEEVELKDASHMWGMKSIDFLRTISKEGREALGKKFKGKREAKEPGSVYIGPAGENLSLVSAVVGKLSHAAGYGAYGAVMGSKNLRQSSPRAQAPCLSPTTRRGSTSSCSRYVTSASPATSGGAGGRAGSATT